MAFLGYRPDSKSAMLLSNRQQSVGMLRRVSEKTTNAIPPSGQPLWHLDDLLGVVMWCAILYKLFRCGSSKVRESAL